MNSFKNRIPVLFCVDVEPDSRKLDRSKPLPWQGYELLFPYLSQLRHEISEKTGVFANFLWCYRIDPQVQLTYGTPEWALTHYGSFTSEIIQEHDSVGLHPHAYRWDETASGWIQDHANFEWLEHCARVANDGFRRVFGRECDLMRFGSRFISTELMNLFEKMGMRYDLTVEPGFGLVKSYHVDDTNTGFLPDTRDALGRPYVPDAADFMKESPVARTITAIPVSMGHAEYRFGRAEKLYRSIFDRRLVGPQLFRLFPGLPPRIFKEVLEDVLSQESGYVFLTLRSDIAMYPNLMNRLEENFRTLLNHPKASSFAFCGPADMHRIWNENQAKQKELTYG